MEPAELLAMLRARGCTVSLVDRCVRVAPASKLTDADRVALRDLKPALLVLLAAPCLDCEGPLPPGHLYRCERCTVAAWRRVYCTAPPEVGR